MYEAHGPIIFFVHADKTMEMCLTVHPMTDRLMTPEEQATALAEILNRLAATF